MTITDSTAIGYAKLINDWVANDSRQFVRDVTSVLDAGDGPTDAYLTIKASPADTDAASLTQLHITTALTAFGQIVANLLTFNVQPGYMGAISVGSVYGYDIVIFTTKGFRYTAETGQIEFQQNTGQEQIGNVPAFAPNNGIPTLRGWASAPPGSPGGPVGIFNLGDVFLQLVPAVGRPAGWECSVPGSPGTWVKLGALS